MIMRICFKIVGKKEKEKLVCEKVEVDKDPLPRKQFETLKNKVRKEVARKFNCSEDDVKNLTLNRYLNATGK